MYLGYELIKLKKNIFNIPNSVPLFFQISSSTFDILEYQSNLFNAGWQKKRLATKLSAHTKNNQFFSFFSRHIE